MKWGNSLKLVWLLLLASQSAHATLADDQADQRQMFEYATANSPSCQGLPIDVPQSVIYKDGAVVARDPAAFSEIRENVALQSQINNCFAQVSNVIQQTFQNEELSPSLKDRIRNGALNFFRTISAVTYSNKAPTITNIKNAGIRG